MPTGQNRPLRLVTWNLWQGRASAEWPRLQANLEAELVFLQESPRPVEGNSIAWQPVPQRNWGSAVVATSGRIRAVEILGYEGWVVGGELLGSAWAEDGAPLLVFSIQAPTGSASAPRKSYIAEVLAVLALIESQVGTGARLILAGDFNFRSLGERAAGESLKTTASERRALARLRELDLVSCWEATHPGQPLKQTLRWTKDRAPLRSTPYHCDGIFVPQAWQGGAMCEILSSACFFVSDHNPVAAWIDGLQPPEKS